MRRLWLALVWAGRQLAFLASLVVACVAALMLPALVVVDYGVNGFGVVIRGFHLDIRPYWRVVGFHLRHLARGQIIPSVESLATGDPLKLIPEQLAATLPVTLKLNGIAFVASLVLGLGCGLLLSARAPRWLRAPFWGTTTLLYALPDLLIASLLNLAVFLGSRLRGINPSWGSEAWHQFWAPTVALTLIVLPYIARVTATAIDEITEEPFIQAAVARGIHPVRILLKHVGKGVLIRVTTIIPVVVSLLFSSGVVVEYITDVRGLGRLLIISVTQPGSPRYAGVAYLMPMLVIFSAVLALSELVQRLLDPRMGSADLVPPSSAGRIGGGLPSLKGAAVGISGLAAWLRSMPAALSGELAGLPRRLRQSVRDPVLLAGLCLVLGLGVVAVAAPWLAPFDPTATKLIRFASDGTVESPPFAPGQEHWLGTDEWGRDTLSRLLFGTRYALLLALLVAPFRFLLGIPLGLLAALRGGFWARLLHWWGTFFAAVPPVLLPLALIPCINQVLKDHPGQSLCWAVLLVALPGAPRLASAVRQQAAAVLVQPFVEAAHAVGAGTGRTLCRYVLPQILPQLVTMLTLEIPAVLTLTALLGYFRSYPGGAKFDTQTYRVVAPLLPEWGSLMERPVSLLLTGRWWLWAPLAALCLAVIAFTLLGEGIRRTWSGVKAPKG
jgi:peptide/nickel transport system permease protein